jgi:phosphoesterase RecJ-like protein
MINYNKIKEILDEFNRIVITTHLVPDADGIGSQIALAMALNKIGKKAVCVNEEKLLDRYNYLDPHQLVTHYDDYLDKLQPDKSLLIVVDTNNTSRIGNKMEGISTYFKKVIYIDHHPSDNVIEDIHFISTLAAATGQLTGEIIKSLGIEFDKELALPLYTAILIDTSSFRYPNVSASTHKLIGELLETGLHPPLAYNEIYGTKKIEHMHLLGKILSTTASNSTGEIAWIIFDHEDLTDFNTDVEDTHAFINNLLVLDEIKIACMFRFDKDFIKISFRSSGSYDVSIPAKVLNGGGHSHAAATIIERDPNLSKEEFIINSIATIEKVLNK